MCLRKKKSDIEWFISNELFHYHDPAHATVDPDNLWMVAQAIRNQSVLEIEDQKLKDSQIVKRMVEPVGLMSQSIISISWLLSQTTPPERLSIKKERSLSNHLSA